MKALALPIIAGALSLYGSAFFGVWTAPGLEGLPTYKVVKEHLPWGAPAEVAPERGVRPLAESVQFLPHGVAANWGDVPVINLPDRKPEQDKMKKDARTAASKPTPAQRPAAPRPVVSAPKSPAPKPAARTSNSGYRQAASGTRSSNNARATLTSNAGRSGYSGRASYSARRSATASQRARSRMQYRRPVTARRVGSPSRAFRR